MSFLSAQDLRRFRERLETQRDAIEARIAARNRTIQATGPGESGVGDVGDESTSIYAREDQTDANDLDRETLAQVNRALDRIDAGTYGVSEVSGEPIPKERLEAVPYAATLVGERLPEPE
jgi:DnaK suppressor protein